jgi:glycosyltransferase involved in cell wall biosynthesis
MARYETLYGGQNVKRLSIYIPTWNRHEHFNALMDSLQGQITNDVEVVASFNPPNDNYRIPEWCRVVRQQSNIGGRVQFLLGPLLTTGDYLWMIGDDDQVQPGGVAAVLEACSTDPGIVVNWDGNLDLGVWPGSRFTNYQEFAQTVYDNGRGTTMTALTLCSATVFRRAAFDMSLALMTTDTMYGQHYGMLSNLLAEPVVVVDRPSFRAATAIHTASIWMHPPEVVTAHLQMYPKVLYDLVHWLNSRMGTQFIPERCWTPGCGFDG